MTEELFPVPFDIPVSFADRDRMRYHLTGLPWSDLDSGKILFAELRANAGNTLAAGDAYFAIRDAVTTWEEGVPHHLGIQFSGDKGVQREHRLIELVMRDRNSIFSLYSISRQYHASQEAMLRATSNDFTLD